MLFIVQGQDVMKFQQQSASSSFVEFRNLNLSPGRRYHSNVRGCNKAGLCNERYSDGAVIDTDPPMAGVVNDGYGKYGINKVK
jgi:hypothetical protein